MPKTDKESAAEEVRQYGIDHEPEAFATQAALCGDEAFVRCLEAALRGRALFAPPPLFGVQWRKYVSADFDEICECIVEASKNAVGLRAHVAKLLKRT